MTVNGDLGENPMNENKKRLQKIHINVMNRLIQTLRENGTEKKTNIARNTNMAYDKCVLYIDILETMDFVKKKIVDRYEMISLTVTGLKYSQRIE